MDETDNVEELKLTKQELDRLVKQIVLETIANECRAGGMLHNTSK